MTNDLIAIGTFISFALRHHPEKAGIVLDKNGWASVEALIQGAQSRGYALTPAVLNQIVETNNKKRFSLDESGTRIRANQGHSVKVDVQLKKAVPPTTLYHGTASRFVGPILKKGLSAMTRQHVHLSADTETAVSVGRRHGTPVVFEVNAKQMLADGVVFYLSENGVWLCNKVLPKYLKLMP